MQPSRPDIRPSGMPNQPSGMDVTKLATIVRNRLCFNNLESHGEF